MANTITLHDVINEDRVGSIGPVYVYKAVFDGTAGIEIIHAPHGLVNPTVNTGTETLSFYQLHGCQTGNKVFFGNRTGLVPTGMKPLTNQYAYCPNGFDMVLYDTRDNAIAAGSTGRVNLTANGTGETVLYDEVRRVYVAGITVVDGDAQNIGLASGGVETVPLQLAANQGPYDTIGNGYVFATKSNQILGMSSSAACTALIRVVCGHRFIVD